jgi:hypothetical protein
MERASLVDSTFQNETVVVRIPSHQVAERLIGNDHSCLDSCFDCFAVEVVYACMMEKMILETSSKRFLKRSILWRRIKRMPRAW